MSYGRTTPSGCLPVYRVADEEEAQALLAYACPTTPDGEYVAPELARKQTIENLEVFSARLDRYHDELVAHGLCRCGKEKKQMAEVKDKQVLTVKGYEMENVNPIAPSRPMYQVGSRVRLIDNGDEGGLHFGEEAIIMGIGEGYGAFYAGQVLYDVQKVEDDSDEPISDMVDRVTEDEIEDSIA